MTMMVMTMIMLMILAVDHHDNVYDDDGSDVDDGGDGHTGEDDDMKCDSTNSLSHFIAGCISSIGSEIWWKSWPEIWSAFRSEILVEISGPEICRKLR